MNNIQATYVSASSFSVAGDMRAILEPGRKIKCFVGEVATVCTVASTSYDSSGNKTTCVISESTLTDALTGMLYAITAPSGLPQHSHVQADLTGVPRILFGTSATPPPAAGLPDGTIYIQVKE